MESHPTSTLEEARLCQRDMDADGLPATFDPATSYWDWLPTELQRKIRLVEVGQDVPDNFVLVGDAKSRLKVDGFDKIARVLRSWNSGRWTESISKDVKYSDLYTIVYTVCTQRPVRYDQEMFEFVHEQARLAAVEFSPDSQQGKIWINLVAHVFVYLDRFYIKRLAMPPLRASLDQEMRKVR